MDFKDTSLMTWLTCSPELNPTENVWNILKRNIYNDEGQFTNKMKLWYAILYSM